MRFKLILETMLGEPRWELDFEQPSVGMAREYTERLVANSVVIRAVDCPVALFSMDEEGTLVQRYALAYPTVRVLERQER